MFCLGFFNPSPTHFSPFYPPVLLCSFRGGGGCCDSGMSIPFSVSFQWKPIFTCFVTDLWRDTRRCHRYRVKTNRAVQTRQMRFSSHRWIALRCDGYSKKDFKRKWHWGSENTGVNFAVWWWVDVSKAQTVASNSSSSNNNNKLQESSGEYLGTRARSPKSQKLHRLRRIIGHWRRHFEWRVTSTGRYTCVFPLSQSWHFPVAD